MGHITGSASQFVEPATQYALGSIEPVVAAIRDSQQIPYDCKQAVIDWIEDNLIDILGSLKDKSGDMLLKVMEHLPSDLEQFIDVIMQILQGL